MPRRSWCPHVKTAEEARHIVEMTRFQPLGRRAVDGGNTDGRYCQIPMAEYMAHSNSERLLIFQIECPEALENVEAIAAVPGYEMLLFGPGDFSHLIGKAGPNQRAGGRGGPQTRGGGRQEARKVRRWPPA